MRTLRIARERQAGGEGGGRLDGHAVRWLLVGASGEGFVHRQGWRVVYAAAGRGKEWGRESPLAARRGARGARQRRWRLW